jgi:hypothetical protein
MVPIIFGIRYFGAVLGCQGQYVATRFFHLYYLPLIPLGSMWVTGEEEPEQEGWLKTTEKVTLGVPLSLHLLSVLTGYVRAWSLVLAAVCFGREDTPWGWLLLSAFLASWTWRAVGGQKARRRRLFGAATGLFCAPELLPPEQASGLLGRLMTEWRKRYGSGAPEALEGPVELATLPLHYAVLRLTARVHGSERASQQAEALFQQVTASPDRAPVQALQETPLVPVLEGTLEGFSRENVPSSGEVVLAWYQQSQWERLRDVSADAGDLPVTYAAWRLEADRLIGQPGLSVHRMDVDVEELICAANLAQGPVDRRFRTGFVRQKAGLRRAA